MEGDFFNFCRAVALKISIHALRVEGDKLKNCPPVTGVYFYPRPPGGGRQAKKLPSGNWRVFLSTPSGWRATCFLFTACRTSRYFYPRPPGGGRPSVFLQACSALISIHALRVEGDLPLPAPSAFSPVFLSTPSGWRATCRISISCSAADGFLSTPSGWRATLFEQREVLVLRFLSTPSGWRATTPSQMPFSNEKFLSTPSGWRATCPKAPAHPHAAISIHALRVEGDCSSRGSQGRRGRISIHALRVEGDKRLYCFGVLKAYFYPRPPGGGRQNCIASIISRLVISIHALRVEGD